jgi:ribonuclease HI
MDNLELEMLSREGKELPEHGGEGFLFSDLEEVFGHEGDIVVMPEFVIECAGICEPNPEGIGAWGFAITCPHNDLIDVQLDDTGRTPENTNNALEYLVVIYALIWISENAPDVPVEIRSSSQTVVKQVNGDFRCYSDSLRPLYESALELMAETKATLRWIPLKENQTAYMLARAAYAHAKKRLEAEGDE